MKIITASLLLFFILCTCLYSKDTNVKVISVWNLTSKDSNVIELNDYISVKVTKLDSLIKMTEGKQNLILFINDIPMRGITPLHIDTVNNNLIFQVTRDSVSLKSWNIIYKHPREYRKIVRISVGYADNFVIPTSAKKMTFIVVHKTWLLISWAGLIILLIIFYFMAKKSNIIKDQCDIKPNPFSLARAQLAFWTFLVVYSFLFIWVLTGDLPMITGTTLVLLSISVATTAGSRIIDQSTPDAPGSYKPSRGFFLDILSDNTGVNIHRFQMVVWTILIGIFFVRYVILNLSMPQLDENLLILMGISNGTYLGLKIPEAKRNKEQEPPVEKPAG